MDVMNIEPVSPRPIKRSSLSPTFEQLSYLDAEPYMQDIYDMSASRPRQSSYYTQSSSTTRRDRNEDAFNHPSQASTFIPSSTSSEGTWDEYIAWDSVRSPVDLQRSWIPQTPQTQAPVPPPLFDDAFDLWKRTEEPDSFETLPSGTGGSAAGPQDVLGAYQFTTTIASYPNILTTATDPSQLSRVKLEPQDSGFVSQTGSYSGRPSLELVLPGSTLNSGSQSPSNDSPMTTSPTQGKRRTSPIKDGRPTTADPTPFKKPRKAKSAAHNDVEKRYRTNLNIKIAELSASVPALRAAAAAANLSDDDEPECKPGYPAKGLKKATILSKATEYIKTLEGERENLEEENKTLRKRLMLCGRIAGEEGLK